MNKKLKVSLKFKKHMKKKNVRLKLTYINFLGLNLWINIKTSYKLLNLYDSGPSTTVII